MATFTAGDFNTGIDRPITIINETTGGVVPYGGYLTDFDSQPQKTKITVKPIDSAYNKFKRTYDGWTGKMTVSRVNGQLDALQAQIEQFYLSTGQNMTFTIDEVTRNKDGTQDYYQYVGCALDMESAGSWKKDAEVPMTIEFEGYRTTPTVL